MYICPLKYKLYSALYLRLQQLLPAYDESKNWTLMFQNHRRKQAFIITTILFIIYGKPHTGKL